MRSVPSEPGVGCPRPEAVGGVALLDKIDDVSHYIHAHSQQAEGVGVGVDDSALALTQDADHRIITVMHPSYASNMCRAVSLETEGVLTESGAGWSVDVGDQLMSAELTEEDGRLAAALVAVHLANNKRLSLHNHHLDNAKVSEVRAEGPHGAVGEQAVLLDAPMRLYNNHGMGGVGTEPIVVEIPPLTPLPPLQDIKTTTWYHTKTDKEPHKEEQLLSDAEQQLELDASPAHNKHNRKSLPHKKRISRKLRRQDLLYVASAPHEQILPDHLVHQPTSLDRHITHEVRALLICQLCGEFYGEDQLKFYRHLKQHYEPSQHAATIIIENPIAHMQHTNHLPMDKMGTCIVDNAAQLPEALVELSLESSVPGKLSLYHNSEKHVLYTSGDKSLSYLNNKCTYATASIDKELYPQEEVGRDLYEEGEKEVFSCTRCNKSFRKQKMCEDHITEAHSSRVEEMSEFSEPEDLMEGIHVLVEGADAGEGGAGGFLTVDNGHVHQDHMKHWYMRNVISEELPAEVGVEDGVTGAEGGMSAAEGGMSGAEGNVVGAEGDVVGADAGSGQLSEQELSHHMEQCPVHLKEEVLQRILESEVDSPLSDVMLEGDTLQPAHEATVAADELPGHHHYSDIKKEKVFECQHCSRVFKHRNSLLYHMLGHSGTRPHKCVDCDKAFYTASALKVHARVHSGDKPYKCSECEREFRQWGDLKYHMVSLHSAKKHYKCDYCGKEFSRKYSLNIHIKIHTGERNYRCQFCSKSFRASSYRLAHVRTHTGEKPFHCQECGKRFRVAGDLRRHLLTHSKSRITKPGRPPITLVNIKIHKDEAHAKMFRSIKPLPRPKSSSNQQILPDHLHVDEKDAWPKKKSATDAEIAFLNRANERESSHNNELLRQRLEMRTGYNCLPYMHRPGDDFKLMGDSSPPRNITPFEHLQKKDSTHNLHISNIRSYASRPEAVPTSEGNENIFLERLTALYNITPIT